MEVAVRVADAKPMHATSANARRWASILFNLKEALRIEIRN